MLPTFRTFRKTAALGMVLALAGIAPLALADKPAEDRAEAKDLFGKAAETFNALVKSDSPDHQIPRELLERASGIAVFPSVVNAAIGVGGRSGQGVVTVRQADGKWSPPVQFEIKGGSWGAQIGAQSTALVLFFMNEGAVRSLLDSKFTLGAKAGVAAGPVGRSAEAATDLKLDAGIYSYAKSKGVFAGLSLEGARISPDKDDHAHLYGGASVEDVLFGGKKVATMPEGADTFLSALPAGATSNTNTNTNK
jgi:lipid-binding SYLF domain-containing protein